jgi:outer membrane protein with beta-barrel domain
MKKFLLVLGLFLVGSLSFAQNGGTTPDLQTRWQQDPGAPQSGGGSSTATKTPSEHPWELDFHVGAAINPRSTGGTSSLPASTTSSSTSGDLLQPSYFFGSGATQASAVTTGNDFGAITPYDNALTTAQAQRKNGVSFGFRIGKDLNRWVGLEYQLDFAFTPLQLSSFAKDLANTSASSASAALSPLAGLTGGVANGQAFIGSEGGKQVFNTLSANFYLRPSDSKWRPYISIGGGILNNTGDDPSVDLLNTIQLGGSLSETDMLRVNYQPQRIAGVLEYGAGVKHFFNEHWGLRLDLRDNMAWESLRTRIFAFPVPPTGGTSTFLFTGNGRSIAFSNDQGTLQSTLSTSVNGVTTFDANSIKHHVDASAGIVFRF